MTPAKKRRTVGIHTLFPGKCQEEDIEGSEALRCECEQVPEPELVILKSKSSDGVWSTKVHQQERSPERQEVTAVSILGVAGALSGGDVSYGKGRHRICEQPLDPVWHSYRQDKETLNL
ncbi:hypothetical protein OIU79_008263 [Salix purpurea]|uniref:Uncharacterized protein n=1 Tax=Salix purpurea TaxID=77065 RepID=A0A9Q0THZ6_SALPP|nr:hypothetical protein OIU79_008263 [Salix purpurea]